MVLQCSRFDGKVCSLDFVEETKQDFSWSKQVATSIGREMDGSPPVSTITAFAALSKPSNANSSVSSRLVADAVRLGRAQILREHLAWWDDYWPQSFVTLGGGDGATRVESSRQQGWR